VGAEVTIQNFTFDKAALLEWLDKVLCVHTEAAVMARSMEAVADDPEMDDRLIQMQSDSQMIIAALLLTMKHFQASMDDDGEYVISVDMMEILKRAEDCGP
jgi:hypothetical protein